MNRPGEFFILRTGRRRCMRGKSLAPLSHRTQRAVDRPHAANQPTAKTGPDATALEVAALILSAAVFGDTGSTGTSRRRAVLLDAGTVYVATVWLAYAAAAAMFAAILGR